MVPLMVSVLVPVVIEVAAWTVMTPELPGVTAFPSDANMILARVPDSKAAFEGMKARGVLVTNVAFVHPLLKNCLRITVGTPDENLKMIDALKASL